MRASVVLKNVTKKYKMYKRTSDKLLDLALPNGYGKDFYALQNITFEAFEGDSIGIIGVNGAGKSTISNLISGVIPPTSGKVKINGDAALISIAAGLNNELTGRENIELKCLMLGFKKADIEVLMPEIIDFAEIGEFIDQPVKKYSSGMKSRLGFAISVNIDPDILVIDEALSVGDKAFAQKCLDKMNSFKEKGKTIFFISHSIGQVKEFCQKALWLEAGEIKAYGPVEEVVPLYEKFIREFNKMSKEEKKKFTDQISERRSRLQHAPIPTDNTASSSRSDLTRKKPKKTFFKRFNSLLVFLFVLALAATLLYSQWDHVAGYLQQDADEKVSVAKEQTPKKPETVDEEPVEEVTEVPAKDIRYVHIEAGFVRDAPDLSNSTKITMVYFGDSISVKETVKDPEGDFNWLRFSLPTGQDGWISERLVTKVEASVDEVEFLETMEELVQVDGISESLEVLGKSRESLTEPQVSNFEITYDDNNIVTEYNVNLGAISRESLVQAVGEPALQEGRNSLLYRGAKVDFILYSQDGRSFTLMAVESAAEVTTSL